MGPADASRIVLASGSPRRRELLELLGARFEVRPAPDEEPPRPGEAPTAYAVRAARAKAEAVAAVHPRSPVLGSDTVVEIDGRVLGKPRSTGEAAAMLRQLSGRAHRVHTAVALVVAGRCRSLLDTAEVRFSEINDETIAWYVATGEPLDKAGAYAVQGAGGVLVESVAGSPQTVVGLPLHRLPELFEASGLDLWDFLE
ncbi:MAG: Maf family protein [Thermoanaerobaculales bacterium]|jgi:septum formation protein|nr:Maf family protein [Thermoanaerobaculales bacterium]